MAKKEEKKKNTAAIVAELVAPVAEECGVSVWDVRFEKEGASWYLRILIDKECGVNINDCENVSRKLDKILDEVDPISQSYILEVSSPGVERDLVKPQHFAQFLGSPVHVRLIRPVDGVQDFYGSLTAAEGEKITILLENTEENEEVEMSFYRNETAFVRLQDDYDMGGLEE